MSGERPDGVDLERYARICSGLVGLASSEEVYAAAQEAGLDRQAWDRVNGYWSARFQEAGAQSPLYRRYTELFQAALAETAEPAPELDLDTYVAINAAVRCGEDQDEVFARFGLNRRSFSLASYAWMERLGQDPWLNARFGLRVQQQIARGTGAAPREEYAVYRAGNMVRSRRCRRCGAVKTTRPRTAYVYCDFCATLFDYDYAITVDDPRLLDPDLVDEALDAVTSDQLARAFREDDRQEYARVLTWRQEVSLEVCPAAYSPRIGDPAYRRRFLLDLAVPWALTTRWDERWMQLSGAFDEAAARVQEGPTLARITALLDRGQATWEREVDLLRREGLFEAHPDRYDADLFLHINRSTFVRPFLAVLGERDQASLLDRAGVRAEYAAAPAVRFEERGCGHCAARLQIPDGATRTMCEFCGFVLETGTRSFACRSCAAPISMPARATEAACAFCGSRWTL